MLVLTGGSLWAPERLYLAVAGVWAMGADLGEIVFLVISYAGDLIRVVSEGAVWGEIVFLFSKTAEIVFLWPENGVSVRSAEGGKERR